MARGIFDRTQLLVGTEGMDKISKTRVIIFGLGGVGSWVAEALVRTGVGHLTIVDSDKVDITNINRQMPATSKTIGENKTDVVARRLLEINPEADIVPIKMFYSAETADQIDLTQYDYIVDAIDSLKDKVLLILNAARSNAKLYSSMGAALKMDPTRIKVAEFRKVTACPLARALRQRFKKHKEFPDKKFLCVYSDELISNRHISDETCEYKIAINGSLVHITAIFGFTLAGLIVEDIVRRESSPCTDVP